MENKFKKIIRYFRIYGFTRTISKVLGRTRWRIPLWLILSYPNYLKNGKKIGIIGCGHHAFSSIAFYISSSTRNKISWVGDINEAASSSMAFSYNATDVYDDFRDPNNIEEIDIVYIASNHATHAEYAIKYLSNDVDVFIEKPIAVNYDQLKALDSSRLKSKGKIYSGFNRPNSAAIKTLRKIATGLSSPISLSCFVIGHVLPEDHWYRDPKEGTRVISNIAHWIDLAIHILFWRDEKPDYLDISIQYSDKSNISENIVINITSSNHDLINLVFSCRGEPFEGVNETINFQQDDLIVKIDDFRDIQIWQSEKYMSKKYRPKDNGHKSTVLQPFSDSSLRRPWNELYHSTALTLDIDEMVKNSDHNARYKFTNQ